MIRINSVKLPLLWLSFVLLVGCFDQSYEASKNIRTQIASNSKDGDPIVVGISWKDDDSDTFIAGVKLAVKEINQNGGVLNSPLQIIINNGESAFNDETLSVRQRRNRVLNIANSFAANPNLIAVIGHSSSSISLLTSVIYQNTGILFLATGARYSKLTGHNFNYTFRTLLSNEESGEQLADYAAQLGYKNIAILHSREDSSTELAHTFATTAVEKYAINIVSQHSFFDNTTDFTTLIIDLKNIQKVDAVFIAASSPLSAKIYTQSRNMGVKLPIIGGETLDSKAFLEHVKQWEKTKDINKSSIPTLFNASAPSSQKFVKQFKEEYGQNIQPTYLAALGYDTVTLLAHAIQLAQSRIPIEIATILRYMEPCKSVSGKYEFKPNGDLKMKPLFFKHFVRNDYVYDQVKDVAVVDESNIPTCNDIDHDHDTIPDNIDACPGTTIEEATKGIIYEGAEKGCPTDSDQDGIGDYKDACPNNTPAEIAKGVDSVGCPVDTDKDGTPDYMDGCPDNSALSNPTKAGDCTADADNDGIADAMDQCPKNTVNEISHGVNLEGKLLGCPVDSDTDLLADYIDACPKNTLLEISQGVDAKGCPVDSDTDQVYDYQDKCLQTPTDVLTDEQGCDIATETSSLESATLFFAENQSGLTETGKNYLDTLLANSNVQLLKKIQITGYEARNGQSLLQARLQSISNYFQQKKIPAEKIKIIAGNSMAQQKNDVINFMLSQYKRRSDTLKNEAKPEGVPHLPNLPSH